MEALALVAALILALADPGPPAALSIHAAGTTDADAGKPVKLVGPDARLQLVVTGAFEGGRAADLTPSVRYSVVPEGVVSVDAAGRVSPLKDGTAVLKAEAEGGASATVQVTVERFADPPAVNFPNRVVPVFTKYGCNGGGCHGKSGGQNGFRLSLLGFEPQEDYEYLVKESFGRRLFPTAPEHSLLMLKASGTLPHGGGERIRVEGADYRLLLRWVSQGMPYGKTEDPVVTGVTVYPRRRTTAPDALQQIKVVAHYSDGASEDVTHAARYEPNDRDLAEVDEAGRVRMLGRPGDVAVMVRYLDRVAVFEATVPLGKPVENLPPVRTPVDEHVFAKLRTLGLPPSAPSDDATFLRRVTLDLTGRMPTAAEARAFLADAGANKRDGIIERLLASEACADFFANKWTSILRNRRIRETYAPGNFAFHEWVRASLLENKPYDRFVRELLTASGEITSNPAVAWFRQVNKDNEQVEDTAQLLLGVRIQCARCHHHPFEKWSRQDYYGLVAFFSQVGRKEGAIQDEERVFHRRAVPQATNPKTNAPVKPTGLGGQPLELTADDDARVALAEWMTRRDNPFLARALVNRMWKHFFGRGIVEPEDDMRETNPPSNGPLLDALERRFVESGFDLRDLLRTIVRSSAYQLSALPNEFNGGDRKSFSRFTPRRLNAEVLLDAIDQLNGTVTDFPGVPASMRAVQIPDHGGISSYFLTVFGRPAGASACECERSGDASLAQSLHLLNSAEIHGKVTGGIAKELAADAGRADADKIADLYLRAFSRTPNEEELKVALGHVGKFEAKDRQKAYEDIVWALINTKEFLFNH